MTAMFPGQQFLNHGSSAHFQIVRFYAAMNTANEELLFVHCFNKHNTIQAQLMQILSFSAVCDLTSFTHLSILVSHQKRGHHI
jgi:hypothetical protein